MVSAVARVNAQDKMQNLQVSRIESEKAEFLLPSCTSLKAH